MQTNTENNIRINVDMTIDTNALSRQKGLLTALRNGYNEESEMRGLLEGVIRILDCIEDKIEDFDVLDYPIVEVNPIEDIKFFVENNGGYDKEIERMTDNGIYEKFLAEVDNKIDWGEVGDNMRTAENEAIAQSVDEVLKRKAFCENDLTNRQLAAETADILEEYLFDKGIVIPCASESEEEDRKESDDSCCALYGSEYWNLVDFLDNALTANTLSKDEIACQLLEEFESLLKSKNIDLQAFKKERGVLQNSISFIIS